MLELFSIKIMEFIKMNKTKKQVKPAFFIL